MFWKKAQKSSIGLAGMITGLIVIAIAVSVAVTSTVSFIAMLSQVSSLSQEQVNSSLKFLEMEVNDTGDMMLMTAKTIASTPPIQDGVEKGDTDGILQSLSQFTGNMDADALIFTDSNGIVLARSDDEKKNGDDISAQSSINGALSGNSGYTVEKDSSNRYVISAGTPIYNQSGKMVGTVAVEYFLDDPAFLDEIKKTMPDDFSIYSGDERYSTTIQTGGKRIVGGKLNPAIAKIVIGQKKTYTGSNTIGGDHYITAYFPLVSEKGDVTGVLSAGKNLKSIEGDISLRLIINIAIGIAAVVLNIIIIITILRKRLKKPLSELVYAAKSIEMGDMDQSVADRLGSIRSRDEIGSLARSMEGALLSVQMVAKDTAVLKKAADENDLTAKVDTSVHNGIYRDIIVIVGNLFSEIASIVEKIKDISESIDSRAAHVSSASQTLAQGATEQASSTEELAATIAEISTQIKSSADNASDANELTGAAGSEIAVSSRYMKELVEAIDEIKHSSGEIEKIIKTIDDIAFQTNILALNAAVEAARAGEAGKGFSVVADEVRNLATKSAEATKSTAALIESSANAVAKGIKTAKSTEQSLKAVVEKAENIVALMGEIAKAVQNESESVIQINQGVELISGTVQTNSATAEETAAASEELAAQARLLQEIVNRYKV